jgi:hypothetical protein
MKRLILALGVAAVLCPGAGAFTQSAGGYACSDSEEATGGPAFAWDDIAATGTLLAFANVDDGKATVAFPAGWSFTFMGTAYTSMAVSTNGFLEFTVPTSTSIGYLNTPVPNTLDPDNLVAAFWDDLHLGSGQVRWQVIGTAPNRRLVVSWLGITHYPSTSPHVFTFQVALFEQGNGVRVQYQAMNDNGGTAFAAGQSATTGVEGSGATGTGNQYGYNGTFPTGATNTIYGGLAVAFLPSTAAAPPWPTTGAPPPPPPPPPPSGGGGGATSAVANDDDASRTHRFCGGSAGPAAHLLAIGLALSAALALMLKGARP